MKRTAALILVLLLFFGSTLCAQAAYDNYAGDVSIAEDVKGFVITAWDDQKFDSLTADMLIIQYTGEDADMPFPTEVTNEAMQEYADNAWHWAEANRGYGDFVVAKKVDENILRFCYDGLTTDDSTADGAFYDYVSKLYSGDTEGQVKRIYCPEGNRLTAYIKYFCYDAGVHKAIRVEWIPDEEGSGAGSWAVSDFYANKVSNFDDAVACARFGYYDYCGGYEVQTKETNLNVRSNPNGEVIGSLKKGSVITVYRHEEIADNGIPYTLIHKTSEPDENGNCYIEYYGWVASEYITEQDDWLWVLAD